MLIGLDNYFLSQVVLVMSWKITLLEDWRFLFMSFQANTTKRFYRKIQDVLPTCLQQRYLCTGFFLLARSEPLILKKLIGFTPQCIALVIWHQMAFRCLLNPHAWWEVLYSLFHQTGLIGIGQKEQIIFLWYLMTLGLASITRWEKYWTFFYHLRK